MLITTDLVMSHGPCSEYSEERLNEILGDGMELTEVLRLDSVPIDDRIWLITRRDILSKAQRKTWLEKVVTRAIVRAKKKCSDKDWNKWADNWLDGSDRSRESTTTAAAAATAADAAAAAVYTAAAYAVYAPDATYYLTYYSANAEKERQIKDALEVLGC